MTLLLYIALWLPLEIAFVDETPTYLKLINYFIDFLFFVDIALTFNTTYYDKDGLLVPSRKTIAINYLKGWFWIDFFTSIPFQAIDDIVDESDGFGR